MSNIYPPTLLASKIEEKLVVKLEVMVTFLWWMKASFPSCSKIPLDEVSALSVPSLLYPPPPQKKDRQVRRAFSFGREPITSQPCTFWERGIKSGWNFYLSLLRVRVYVEIRVDRVCRRHFKRNTSCCSCMEMVPAWMLHRKYKNMLPVKLLSIVNSR